VLRKTEIGMPVVLKRGNETVYGRVAEFKGTWGAGADGPVNSYVKVRTPHGSEIETGVFWLYHPDEHEMNKLAEFDELARKAAEEARSE
jgi:hypothetical protein